MLGVFVLAVIQIAIGIPALIWLWALTIRAWSNPKQGFRERVIFWAVVSFSSGIAVDIYFWCGQTTPFRFSQPFVLASFTLYLLGGVLALLGTGSGRILMAIVSCVLALSWVPFILASVLYS